MSCSFSRQIRRCGHRKPSCRKLSFLLACNDVGIRSAPGHFLMFRMQCLHSVSPVCPGKKIYVPRLPQTSASGYTLHTYLFRSPSSSPALGRFVACKVPSASFCSSVVPGLQIDVRHYEVLYHQHVHPEIHRHLPSRSRKETVVRFRRCFRSLDHPPIGRRRMKRVGDEHISERRLVRETERGPQTRACDDGGTSARHCIIAAREKSLRGSVQRGESAEGRRFEGKVASGSFRLFLVPVVHSSFCVLLVSVVHSSGKQTAFDPFRPR